MKFRYILAIFVLFAQKWIHRVGALTNIMGFTNITFGFWCVGEFEP